MKPALSKISNGRPLLLALAILALAVVVLLAMGRPALCPCGTVRLWQGVVESAENSQQILDWYTPSHILHGILFAGAASLIARRWAGFRPWALPVATLIEAVWEIAENSPMIIDRYRAVTLSWGYSGDSVLNSASDIAAMIGGFLLARRLGWRWMLPLALALELVPLAVVRDNLTLNVLMLLAPQEAVRRWQAEG